jgi:DNA-binding SARP family transcriptional activator/TolB-like protein
MNRNVRPPLAAVKTLGGLKSDQRQSRERPIVRIHLLGPMRATTYLGDNVLPHGKRARAVLGYLCLAAGEHVPRAELAALLWDRISAPAARTNLRQAVRELSLSFGGLASEIITSGRDVIRLNLEACWVDALAALTLDPGALEVPDELLALCRGQLLEDLDGTSASFDRWLAGERTRVTGRLQALLERALDRIEPRSNTGRPLASALARMRERAQTLEEHARRKARWQAALRSESNAAAASGAPAGEQPAAVAVSGVTRDRLRVGVLPFLAPTSRREENLAFSLSQEIAAALARFRWFDVIAPISLRQTPATPFIDERQLRLMDLDYAVDGTVAGTGKDLHIEIRLMELAEYARPVWRECFDLPVGELHRLNELVTTPIVGRIDPIILFIEGQPNRREHYGATGLLLLAIPLIFSMERTKYEEAGVLIERALEKEPDNAMVAAWAAHWHLFYAGQGWSQEIARTNEITQKLALRAIKLDPNNAEALGIYAHICSIVNKDFDSSLYYFDRSLRLNPSLGFSWALSAPTFCYIGQPEIALQRLKRYEELAPLDPYSSWFEHLYTLAYTFKGDYERAVIVGRRSTRTNPEFVAGYRPLIASLGHLGRREEAKPYLEKLLSLQPGFTIEQFGRTYPFKWDRDRQHYLQGLRLAGVPER